MLSYDEFTKGYLLQHLVELLDCYRPLQLKKVTVRSVNLLQVDDKYSICFLEFYPRRRPNVRVNCPDNTIIRKDVASSGVVSAHPYLQKWKLHDSNVVSLVKQLGKEFSLKLPFASPNLDGVLSHEQVYTCPF